MRPACVGRSPVRSRSDGLCNRDCSCFLWVSARLMVRMSMATGDAFEHGPAPVSQGGGERADRPSRGRRRGGRGRGGRRRHGGGGEARQDDAAPESSPDTRSRSDTGSEEVRTASRPAEAVEDTSSSATPEPAGAPEAPPLPGKPPGTSATVTSVAGSANTSPRTRPRAIEEALQRMHEVLTGLKEVLEELEEAAELLDMAAEQKEEMSRELDRLNQMLNQLQRPREGHRVGGR